MKLYLCEKPKQGGDVAKFLGMTSTHKKNGYYQKDHVAVTWARGHLFKLQPPEYYQPSIKGKWAFDKLPVIPDPFKYILDVKAKAQFKTIKSLLRKAEVVYVATDPDPEGECIARNILKFAGYKGDTYRVLFGATDKKSLTKAFGKPLSIKETEWMYQSALARAQSDWVVGMNLTMAMTLLVQKLESSGKFKKAKAFPVGRVKIPAAMLVYLRKEAIKKFKPTKYYEIEVDVFTQSGDIFTLSWDIPERAMKDSRLVDKNYALKAVEYFQAQKLGVISKLDKEDKKKQPPLPFELTTLQSACDKYDISPDETLEIAQSLYDNPLSSTSYPRSDIPFLSEGLAENIKETVGHLTNIAVFEPLKNSLDLERRTKAWNDKKVKVHHGIIPTPNAIDFSRLTPKQRAVYVLIAKRYLVQFMPDYVYEHTKIEVKIGNLVCSAVCNVPKVKGWRSIEDVEEEITTTLPQLTNGQKLGVKDVRLLEKSTRKPPQYTQASLAVAMVNIASEIEDPILCAALDEKDGIGTIATRPAIIKDLVKSGLLVEKTRKLSTSRWFDKYMKFIPEQMKQPANSALWERGFSAIKDGQLDKDKFVDFQTKFVKAAVADLAKTYSEIK